MSSKFAGNIFRMAEVVAVHPESHSVDLVYIDDGSRVADVPVMSQSATTRSGTVDLPEIESTEGQAFDIKDTSQVRAIAVVGMCSGYPMVVGYQMPAVNELAFKDHKNLKISRHASDTHTITQDDGSVEIQHPAGGFIKMGSSTNKMDLSQKDYDSKWSIRRNKDKECYLTAQANGARITIEPDGSVRIDAGSGANIYLNCGGGSAGGDAGGEGGGGGTGGDGGGGNVDTDHNAKDAGAYMVSESLFDEARADNVAQHSENAVAYTPNTALLRTRPFAESTGTPHYEEIYDATPFKPSNADIFFYAVKNGVATCSRVKTTTPDYTAWETEDLPVLDTVFNAEYGGSYQVFDNNGVDFWGMLYAHTKNKTSTQTYILDKEVDVGSVCALGWHYPYLMQPEQLFYWTRILRKPS